MDGCTSDSSRNDFRKIRVFISSKCGDSEPGKLGRFDQMRREIARRLDSSPVFAPYLWERGGASTANAERNYIGELNDSDICVIVIDNKDGVTPGVQKEIDQVIQTDKRALFYFVSEFSDVSTLLQKQLEGPSGRTYKIVQKIDDVPDCVVGDLQHDVLMLYRRWCNHDVVENQQALTTFDVSDKAIIPSSALDSLPGLRGVFGQLIFNEAPCESENGLDAELTKFASALYISHTTRHFDYSGLLKLSSEILPENYSQLICLRWQAINRYFCGLKSEAISILEQALEYARQSSIESWVVDDLLIDLRNIQIEVDVDDPFGWKYQESLSDNGREIVYPVVDRAVLDTLKNLEDNRIKKAIENYSSFTIGENALRFFKPLCKAFAAAACFGSLTHLSLIAVRMRDVVYYLCTLYRDANLNASLLKLTIATGRPGDAQGVLQAFNAIRFDSDSSLAKKVFDFCSGYSCLNSRSYALFEAFGELSCYLSETDYMQALSSFIKNAEDEMERAEVPENSPKAIFSAMRHSSDRLSLSWMIDYAVRSIAVDKSSWAIESLRFLSECNCHFSELDNVTFAKLLDSLDCAIGSAVGPLNVSVFCDALMNIGVSVDDSRKDCINNLAMKLPANEHERYKAWTGFEADDSVAVEMVKDAANRIREHNKTQGVSGYFAGGIANSLRSAKLLLSMDQPPLQLAKELYGSCLGTLASPTYDVRGKVDACGALCSLVRQFGFTELGYISETVDVIENGAMRVGEIGFCKDSPLLLNVWVCCLALLTGEIADAGDQLRRMLAFCYQSDAYNQARAGDALKYLVDFKFEGKVSDSVLGVVFSYACYLATARHFQLNLRGFELLRLFLSLDAYQRSAGMILCDSYYGQCPRAKKEIVDSIVPIAAFDEELASELRDKVLRDGTTTVVAYLKKIESNTD